MLFFQSNDDRVELLNKRIHSRLNPSSVAPMSFSPRPVSTKYALFPMIDHVARADAFIEAKRPPAFLPADSAPFSGFNVQQESNLRSLSFPLQRDSMAAYFPNSASDLYTAPVPSTPRIQTHPLLFAEVKGYAPKTVPTLKAFNNFKPRTFSSPPHK